MVLLEKYYSNLQYIVYTMGCNFLLLLLGVNSRDFFISSGDRCSWLAWLVFIFFIETPTWAHGLNMARNGAELGPIIGLKHGSQHRPEAHQGSRQQGSLSHQNPF